MNPRRSPDGDRSTSHWYNPDGSFSRWYLEKLRGSGVSAEKIAQMNRTAQKEWKYLLRGQKLRMTTPGTMPLKTLVIQLQQQPVWELVSEGWIDPGNLDSYAR